jgi:hypothetical protein
MRTAMFLDRHRGVRCAVGVLDQRWLVWPCARPPAPPEALVLSRGGVHSHRQRPARVDRWILPRILAVTLLAAPAAGCKPDVGGKCTFGQASCSDDGTAGLFCGDNGRFRSVSCRGKGGCQRFGARVWCDQSLSSEGEPCTKPGFACTTDRRSALACSDDGSFALAATCAGPGGCKVTVFDRLVPGGSGGILCDHDVANPRDPCLDDGDVACSPDKMIALKCSGRTMTASATCHGPKHCAVLRAPGKGPELACDEGEGSGDDGGAVADAGAPLRDGSPR